MPSLIEVTITGAVVKGGKYQLETPTTVSKILKAAGGLMQEKTTMRASGIITVRRPLGNREVDVWKFNLADSDSELEGLELRSGDLVVVQYDVTSNIP